MQKDDWTCGLNPSVTAVGYFSEWVWYFGAQLVDGERYIRQYRGICTTEVYSTETLGVPKSAWRRQW